MRGFTSPAVGMLICFVLFGAQPMGAQVTEEWVARYNGPGDGNDIARALAVDSLGNVYVVGGSWGTDPLGRDYATIMYDSSGNTVWVSRYSGGTNITDNASALAVDDSGSVLVTGTSMGPTAYDYATIKYSSTGDSLWVRRYDGPASSNDGANAIAVDDSGNVYVTGVSWGSGTLADFATVKYSSSGDSLWARRYTEGNVGGFAIAVDDSHNVYVTGGSSGSGVFGEYVTIKYSKNGDTLWVRKYAGPGDDYDRAVALAVDDSGNVYVTGRNKGSGTGWDYATIKYDSNGNTVWVTRYEGPRDDEASDLAVDGLGNVYVTGTTDGASQTWDDYLTVKYSSSGESLWVRMYNGPGNCDEAATAIAVDGSGDVYVTGWSGAYRDSFFTHNDYVTIRYSSSGDQLWLMSYSVGDGDDDAHDLVVDPLGNVYVTGISESDYATIKYSQIVGVDEENRGLDVEGTMAVLQQNQPNPFRGSTVISYSLPLAELLTLEVYDIAGRLMESLVDERQWPGVYQVQWKVKDKASGIYFCRLQAGDFTDTKKMLLLH